VERDEWLLHGSSFGAAAAAYAEHRPDPETADGEFTLPMLTCVLRLPRL
jgi:hypothetical protein